MADPLSPDAFYESARDFAQTSLQAHNKGEPRRFALDAGTALEHLAKACPGARSPALLTDLNGEANFSSLLRLLGISGSQAAGPLRTIGLWVALERVRALVTSSVSVKDLRTLVEMRNGTVHAAQDDEIEEHLVVAFAVLIALSADAWNWYRPWMPSITTARPPKNPSTQRGTASHIARTGTDAALTITIVC